MDIKECALTLVSQHETRDPFQIAKELDFIIIFTQLDGIRGFYQFINRCHNHLYQRRFR